MMDETYKEIFHRIRDHLMANRINTTRQDDMIGYDDVFKMLIYELLVWPSMQQQKQPDTDEQ